jgi:hypothetical protein
MGLDDPGDMTQPVGSPKWAHGLRYKLYRLAKDSTAKLREFQDYVALMEQHQGYKYLPDDQGRPFVSVRAFLVTKAPFGAGYDPTVVDAIMAETRDMLLVDTVKEAQRQKNLAADAHNSAVQHGGDRKSAAYQEIKHDTNKKDIMVDHGAAQGTSRTYALRRLARSPDPAHQDLYQQCLAGDLTPNAAMVQAGFRTRPPSRKRTPSDTMRHLWAQVPPDERLWVVYELLTPEEAQTLGRLLYREYYGDDWDDDEDADSPARTLHQAYAYFLARCQEGGLTLEQAEAAWLAHASPALEDELLEAESYGPNTMRMIDEQILTHLGLPPHEAEVRVEDEDDDA